MLGFGVGSTCIYNIKLKTTLESNDTGFRRLTVLHDVQMLFHKVVGDEPSIPIHEVDNH